MLTITAEEFYLKAMKFICTKSHYLKDDFPGYAIEWFLKKERHGYNFQYLWADYLRRTDGDIRSSCHRNREFVEYVDDYKQRYRSDESGNYSGIDLENSGSRIKQLIEHCREDKIDIYLESLDNKNSEIAKKLNVTEARISQIRREVTDKIELINCYMEKKYERDLVIKWITI